MPALAYLPTPDEWQAVLIRLAQLENARAATAATTPAPAAPAEADDTLLTVREAAAFLRVNPEAVRRARRQKRLTGVMRNEKEWGFRRSELNRYLRRYNRTAN